MSLDLTNSDMLDCSPFAENYSYITRTSPTAVPRTATRPAPAPTTPRTTTPRTTTPRTTTPRITPRYVPTGSTVPTGSVSSGSVVSKPPVSTRPPAVVVEVVAPYPVMDSVMPMMPPMPMPTSGGGFGGGGGGSTERQAGEGTGDTTQTGATASESKEFYKSYWFWGLLVGGIGGYLLAKNKGKSLMAYGLIGAGVGGGVGFGIEKTFGKKKVTAPTAPQQ